LAQPTTAITLQARKDEAGVLRIYSMDGQPCDMVAISAGDAETAYRLSMSMAQYWRKAMGMEPLPTGKQLKKAAYGHHR
jgi:hypothetical protein